MLPFAPVLTAITSRISDALSDLSIVGWAVLLVIAALFAARALHRPISYRHLSRQEKRMIRNHRASAGRTRSYIGNNGKKVTKEQFYKEQKQFYQDFDSKGFRKSYPNRRYKNRNSRSLYRRQYKKNSGY